jgi:hypothetical protein
VISCTHFFKTRRIPWAFQKSICFYNSCIKSCTYRSCFSKHVFLTKTKAMHAGKVHAQGYKQALCRSRLFLADFEGTIRGYSGLFKSVLRIRIRIHMYWASWIQIHWSEVRIRIRIWILLSSSKNSKKNLDSYCSVTFFYFLSLKKDVYVPSKVVSRKNFFLN